MTPTSMSMFIVRVRLSSALASPPLPFLQDHVVKEDLLNALYCEFINRVNEVGVDVNRAIAHPYTQSLVQYVCGLGPRKGAHLLKVNQHCIVQVIGCKAK